MIILGPFLLELQNGAGLVWGKVEKGGRYPHRSQSNSSLACVGLICAVDSCQGPDSALAESLSGGRDLHGTFK